MKNIFAFLITFTLLFSFGLNANAALCGKELQLSIKMDDDWYKKEELRQKEEKDLLQKYAQYITKKNKRLKAEPYICDKEEDCDPIKNCQMENRIRKLRDMEYSMKTDSGIIIQKSHCSVIGKCIGYNDFFHSKEVTAAEDRLIDIKKDNAVFYHYFYTAHSDNYEPPFNMTNLHSGKEIYFDDIPHFSPDETVIIEIRSLEKKEPEGKFPSGFNINIYELNENGEYVNVEPAETDPEDPKKIISNFLSRNPSCGKTPYFHSWQSNREVRISMLPSSQANEGKRVILSYDPQTKKWGCKEEVFPEVKCNSYLPSSVAFSSNLAVEQINECH